MTRQNDGRWSSKLFNISTQFVCIVVTVSATSLKIQLALACGFQYRYLHHHAKRETFAGNRVVVVNTTKTQQQVQRSGSLLVESASNHVRGS